MAQITFPAGTIRLPGPLMIAQADDGALTLTFPPGATEMPGPIVLPRAGGVRLIGASQPAHN